MFIIDSLSTKLNKVGKKLFKQILRLKQIPFLSLCKIETVVCLRGQYGVIVQNHAAREHQHERERVTTRPRKDLGLTVSENVHRVNLVIRRRVLLRRRRRQRQQPPSPRPPRQHAPLLLQVPME